MESNNFPPPIPPGYKKVSMSNSRYEKDIVDVHFHMPSEIFALLRTKLAARGITLKRAMMEASFEWLQSEPHPVNMSGVIFHWERPRNSAY